MIFKGARGSDIILAVFLVAITAMLLIPLPTLLLDFLLVINLALAVLLLLAGLYMSNALAMLSFPSILLLTTLFRLGLNVASTRLILSEGYAGRVIQAFGSFLIRGEVVVGIIIFLIITIVNFIVIARGATRVSEVAARFALDALPGKQMAIDSDLRAGLVSAEEAQRRRDDLRKESQLYGSMDGAMKFVQGDAIAGLFIIVTNIVGGMYLGISGGMGFAEAVQTYTIMTVGDGLVNQIPAILISICAGIVVTRVSSGEHSSLGADMQSQIFGSSGTMMFAGALMMLIGLLPGLPFLPFVTIGLLMLAAGALKRRPVLGEMSTQLVRGEMLAVRSGRGGVPLGIEDSADQLLASVLLDSTALYRLYRDNPEHYHSWWRQFQADYYDDSGLRLPALRFMSESLLPVGRFSVLVDGAVIESDSVIPEALLLEVNPENCGLLGLEVVRECTHPLTGSRVLWAAQSPELKRVTEAGRLRAFDAIQYIGLRVAAFYDRFPEESINVAEVLSLETELEKKYPGLLSQTLNREFLNTPRLTETLQQLSREKVSIRDFKQIVEAVASYCSTVGVSLVQEGEFDLNDVVAFVRTSRRRHILSKRLSARRTLKVITLSSDLESLLEELPPASAGAPLALPPETRDRLRRSLSDIMVPLLNRGLPPVSVLCRSDVRPKLSGFVFGAYPGLGIVTLDELDPAIPVEPAAVWRI